MLKRVLAVFLFFAIFTAQSFSQDTSEIKIPTKTYALQFQIADNFSFTSFQGALFSGKYHFANGNAVRMGLNVNEQNYEYDIDNFVNDTLYSNEINDGGGLSLSLRLQYLFYSNVKEDVALYYGGGPLLQYYNGEVNRKNSEGIIFEEKTQTQWGIGLSLVIGGEWFVRKNIGLSLEYGLETSYSRSELKAKESNRNPGLGQTKKEFKIKPNNVLFGVSVYF